MNIIFKDYPYFSAESMDDVKAQLRQICSTRKDDITQINNIVNNYVAGRKVGKIPTSSADVAPTDRLGDVNYTATFMYVLIDNAGTAEWRRTALGAF